MFVHEMGETECKLALQGAKVGRLACARDNQPYVVPINYAFHGDYIYGFTTVGQKVEWMRSNPLVCFEMDRVIDSSQWVSVVVFGEYEELPDTPEHRCARFQAHRYLGRHAMWWEPAYISEKHREQTHSLTPVFFRIHIDKMTGHRATLDTGFARPATSANAKQGWLGRLVHLN